MSDDGRLLASLRAGDRDAGRELFRRHAPSVLRFFRSKFPEMAEDLTQEVFTRFLRDTRDTLHVRGFLFGIARYVLSEELRRRRPDADVGITSMADLERVSSTRMVQRHQLLRALQTLPLEQQIVIELHYWEGLDSEELGAALGIPASTVRGRLSVARERLRDSLRKSFPRRPAQDFVDLDAWVARLRAELDGG